MCSQGHFLYLAEVGCFLKNIFSVAEAAESGMVCEKQVGPLGLVVTGGPCQQALPQGELDAWEFQELCFSSCLKPAGMFLPSDAWFSLLVPGSQSSVSC